MRKSLFFIRQTLLTLAAIFAFSFSAAAAAVTVAEYRENIEHLRVDLDALIEPDAEATDKQNAAFEREVLEEFPKMLPARQPVEWRNSTIETNNQWIYDALQRFEKESSPPKRRMILMEISERLAALEAKLDELDEPAAEARTKDADKQKLAEILRRAEYQKPTEKQESAIERWYKRIVEWLAEMFPRPNISPSVSGGFQSLSFVLQMLLYALILGAIAFLIYRFAPLFINRDGYRKKRASKERVVLGERLAADETARNLFDEAESLARAGNLRGAIRKGYIALLCELSDRKIVKLSQHKTNRDYLRDVRQKKDLHENMSGLTADYERYWYGAKNVEETDWEKFKSGYRKAFDIR